MNVKWEMMRMKNDQSKLFDSRQITDNKMLIVDNDHFYTIIFILRFCLSVLYTLWKEWVSVRTWLAMYSFHTPSHNSADKLGRMLFVHKERKY